MGDAVGSRRLVEKCRQQRMAWSREELGYLIFAKIIFTEAFWKDMKRRWLDSVRPEERV